MALKRYQNKNWLSKEYVAKRRTVEQIAKDENVSPKTIDRYLDKFDLKRNRRTWSRG